MSRTLFNTYQLDTPNKDEDLIPQEKLLNFVAHDFMMQNLLQMNYYKQN